MSRRLLFLLVVLVGLAGLIVAAVVTFASVEDETRTVHPGPVNSVEVDVEVGRVTLVAGTGDDATVDRTRRYIRGAPKITDTLVDGVLRLQAECPTFVTVGCKVDYRVEVPASVPVRVRADRGSVVVENILGMVDVETKAGGIRLVGTRGPARLATSAGNIDGVDLVAEFVDATTDAGRVRLSLAEPSGRVGVRTDAGNVDLALPPAPGGYRVSTDTGAGKVDVTVEQDPEAARAVTAKTGAGNISIRPR